MDGRWPGYCSVSAIFLFSLPEGVGKTRVELCAGLFAEIARIRLRKYTALVPNYVSHIISVSYQKSKCIEGTCTIGAYV